ncbi:ABC transporter substrate-binding protein [Rathayibacter soli]|uniref:ABC transporter substrate-binding protein n=1 Tax=Rathayibacter soli TaxID=3144168 RepID=UPI0027E59267|nr:extracellular solute-binding protein [Glaciibacter superstes]
MKRLIGLLAIGAAVAACLTGCGGAGVSAQSTSAASSASGSGSGTLVVWNWGDPGGESTEYSAQVLAVFKKEHPNVQVQVVSQPNANYYTLLGAAIQSNSGPDVVLFNGGSQIWSRTSALVPLNKYVPAADAKRLTGWDMFSKGSTKYAVPTTMQGFALYYNKKVLKEAGITSAPKTWDQLSADCAAVKSKTQASCFALGNKEGLGFGLFFSEFGPGILTPTEYQNWLDGKRDWNSPDVKKVFDLWKQTYDDGWYNAGVNSTAMFNDSFNLFSAGKAAFVVGLTSGSDNYRQFGQYLGKNLGVTLPPIENPKVTETFMPIEGGIGFGVTKWTKNPKLAAQLALAYADHGALTTFSVDAGAVSADTTITPKTTNQAGKDIFSWLKNGKSLLHDKVSADTENLMGQLTTEILEGSVSVDSAISQLAASDAKTSGQL